eukprot:TRINITY_DN32403_c0_g1_i1.p1 TRINITY_DN32403_c0_g1~~TRINITY_DN32403_c0_g1_i1.p1  ORF type:complete len:288 (+),score=70.82 TRINITY_DN32403_c0_g1_i1:101-964(+)
MGKAMSVLGNVTTSSILLVADLATSLITWTSRSLVGVVDCICGSGKNTVRRRVPWHEQRYSNAPVHSEGGMSWGELDVDATMKQSTFPIKPPELVEKAKAVLGCEFGTAPGADASCLADDFQFVAPIVGPLSKAEFIQAFGSFKVKEALPDLKDNSWFQVDPLEPNRVWFFSRATGTHTGTLNFGAGVPATGRKVNMPPQAQSMLFNEQGQCYTLTVGYAMDKRIGNTEGLGGVFGILKAVGKALPFPEAQRLYNPSLRFEAFDRLAKAAEAFGVGPGAVKTQAKKA